MAKQKPSLNQADVNLLKKTFATKKDLKKVEGSTGKQIEELKKEILAHKWDTDKKIDDHEEKTREMITGYKDEVVNGIDKVMGELKTSREEYTIKIGKISEHNDQLEKHEQRITSLEQMPAFS